MITLNVNKFLGAITNLIGYTQVANTMQAGEIGRFVSSFQDVNVENGDGKVVYAADLLTVKDLSGKSSLLESNPPTVNEQYIDVENYKVIPLTINKYLIRNAFVDETQLSNFTGYIMSIMQTTKTVYLSNELLKKIEAYVPAQESQKIKVKTIDISTLTDPMQIEAAKRYNAKAFEKAFIKKLQAMGWDSNKYNDLQYTEVIDFSSLKLLIDSDTDTDIMIEVVSSLLNSNKITEAQKWGETYVIPDEKFTSPKYKAWLMHNKKVQFGYFYQVATSFFDGSTLNQNDFLHFSYYMDIVKALPCVCFAVDPSIKPAALKELAV